MAILQRETLGQCTATGIVSSAMLETIQNTGKHQNHWAPKHTQITALYRGGLAHMATHPPPCADTPLERLKTPLDPGGGRSGIGCKKGGPLPLPHFLFKNISPLLLIPHKDYN